MSSPDCTLKWSTQLLATPSNRAPKLVGDKITLPQAALEALLAAAPAIDVQNGFRPRNLTSHFDPFNPLTFAAERHAREQTSDRQQQLPHPLTFKIVNPHNGRAVYAGIREFSAEDGEVGLSAFLRAALGLQDGGSPRESARGNTPNGDVDTKDAINVEGYAITVHAKQLPKGTFVRLRPLEAGYDPEDWKSLLEKYLRDNFTTLTKGELLDITGARHEHFRFLVDKFEPDVDGVCIVDTDLEVDIEALNEEQARETLQKRLAKSKRAPGTAEGSSNGGPVVQEQEVRGQVVPGEYVDYDLKEWNRNEPMQINIETEEHSLVDVFVSPFSNHHRARPRDDEHVFANLDGQPSKRLCLSPTNVELEEAESLYIAVHAWKDQSASSDSLLRPLSYTLKISTGNHHTDTSSAVGEPLGPDEVVCKNCQQHIPKRTLPLHEAFCYRNNVCCPKCSNVFLKSSQAWKDHWHCPHDEDHGNTFQSQAKHDSIFHPPSPIQCPSCDFQAFNLPILAHHRTSTCPGKDILCQFCHLVVPQQGPEDPSFTDPEVLLSGLSPHELADGARTTECHLCGKIIRLRDMKTHLRLHDRDRLTKPRPEVCVNKMCMRTINSRDGGRVVKEQLSLCSECFGPLYVATYDPEGKALRRRIERRLLQQMIGGCGKPWCANLDWCKSAFRNANNQERSLSAKEALGVIKPVMDQLARGESKDLRFCVDEGTQKQKVMGELVAAEGEYEVEWCIKALEEAKGDLMRARDWLKDRAPKIGEVVR